MALDGLALLTEAHGLGLRVAAEGDRLVIRGPRSAEAAVARLIAHKPVVLAALARRNEGADDGRGTDPCAPGSDDCAPDGSAPILHLPPRDCLGPRVCARLGPCQRHAAGAPCLVTVTQENATWPAS